MQHQARHIHREHYPAHGYHHRDGGHGHHGDCGKDGVFPPDVTLGGLTLEGWLERWWVSVLQSDLDRNIVIGSDPEDAQLGDTGRVHMLGGLFAPADENGDLGSVARRVEVDRGDAILVPVLNFIDIEGGPAFGTPDGVDPVDRLDEVIGNWLASIDWDNTSLVVDGKEIDLAPHLHRTEVFSAGLVEEGTVAAGSLGAPVDEEMEFSAAAGIMVMLRPLAPGEHQIAWEGTTKAILGRDGEPLPGTSDFHYEVQDTISIW